MYRISLFSNFTYQPFWEGYTLLIESWFPTNKKKKEINEVVIKINHENYYVLKKSPRNVDSNKIHYPVLNVLVKILKFSQIFECSFIVNFVNHVSIFSLLTNLNVGKCIIVFDYRQRKVVVLNGVFSNQICPGITTFRGKDFQCNFSSEKESENKQLMLQTFF